MLYFCDICVKALKPSSNRTSSLWPFRFVPLAKTQSILLSDEEGTHMRFQSPTRPHPPCRVACWDFSCVNVLMLVYLFLGSEKG